MAALRPFNGPQGSQLFWRICNPTILNRGFVIPFSKESAKIVKNWIGNVKNPKKKKTFGEKAHFGMVTTPIQQACKSPIVQVSCECVFFGPLSR